MTDQIRNFVKSKKLDTGCELIAKERQRQIEKEGCSQERDIRIHHSFQLSRAAACYAYQTPFDIQPVPAAWPWADEWWKPTPENPVRQLVKAGALIAAEIDRLQRIT